MKGFLLYLWQLPQNLLGLIVILFSKATKSSWEDSLYKDVYFTRKRFGVSLGHYIIVHILCAPLDIRHEIGHQKQSLYLGWLYLPTVGLLSACGNLWDRWFHRNWDIMKSITWYYNLPWEHWADKLGGVKR